MPTENNIGKQCKEEGCLLPAKSRGYCKKHYSEHYRLGEFSNDINKWENKKCEVEGCDLPVYGRQIYCHKHYQRVKKHNDPNWKEESMHGLSKAPEYAVWEHMKERCYRKTNTAYKNYGGRGISVCDRWRNSFLAFYEDMGDRPSSKHQLDRIDNNGNYEPDNCRWVTVEKNARNKRNNVLTEDKVRQIRKKYANGISGYKLSKQYKCSYTNIKDVLNNKIWRNV